MDEKHLLKLMDKAYKSGGYLLICGERGVELCCREAWRFGIDKDKVTAKLKAKLVEHMDFLPTEHGAWWVRPDGAQYAEMTVALQEAAAWIPMRMLPVLQTAITYGGLVFYQNEKTKVCAAIPSSWLLTAGQTGISVDTAAGLCYCEEEGVSASGICVTKRTETATDNGLKLRAVLKALEQVRIVGACVEEELAGQQDLMDSGENAEGTESE